VDGGNQFVLTFPVLEGAEFSGTAAKTATVGKLTYHVEGSDGLSVFDREVEELAPARAEGLPMLESGWSYRSFRMAGAVQGTGSRGPAGFMRVKIVATS
jgi:hypothetical protein